jgi:putative endonuclease
MKVLREINEKFLHLQPDKREFSSAGLEHLPYKQRVGGSIPSTPTPLTHSTKRVSFFMYSVYILRSLKSRQFYKGQTNDLNRRIKEHNNLEEKSTAKNAPWELVFVTEVPTRSEALLLEKKLKNITSKVKLEAFINKYSREKKGGPDATP